MKHLVFIFAIVFGLQEMALAQGEIGTFPPNSLGNIRFVAISNAPLNNLPSGLASYSPLIFSPDAGVSTDILEVDIYLGSDRNAEGWIVQKGNDGSLTPIIELSVEPDFAGTVGVYPGMPPSSYNDFVITQLTAAQVQNFLAGQLYAQISFGSDSYLGQLLPVPEPSSVTLILCSLGIFALLIFKKRSPSSTLGR